MKASTAPRHQPITNTHPPNPYLLSKVYIALVDPNKEELFSWKSSQRRLFLPCCQATSRSCKPIQPSAQWCLHTRRAEAEPFYHSDRNLTKTTGNMLHVANFKEFQKCGRGKEARLFPARHVYLLLSPGLPLTVHPIRHLSLLPHPDSKKEASRRCPVCTWWHQFWRWPASWTTVRICTRNSTDIILFSPTPLGCSLISQTL